MSGIMEKNLPMAEEVTSENLIRTVSGGGNSENMTVEQLGELIGGDNDGKIILLEEQLLSSGFCVADPSRELNFANAFPFIPIYEDINNGDVWSLSLVSKQTTPSTRYNFDWYGRIGATSFLWVGDCVGCAFSHGASTRGISLIKLTDEFKNRCSWYFGTSELTNLGDAKGIIVAQIPNSSIDNTDEGIPLTLVKGNITNYEI